MKKLQNRKGFTLVELLIVIAIIGILVLIAVPRFTRTTEISKVRTLQANTRTIASAAGLFIADNSGNEPADLAALETAGYVNRNLANKPNGATYNYTPSNGTTAGFAQGQLTLSKELDNNTVTILTNEGVTISGTSVTVKVDVN